MASLVPKVEPEDTSEATPTQGPNFVDLEERILQLCAESPKGITDDLISQDQPLLDTERRIKALQRLLSQVCFGRSVCVRKGRGGEDQGVYVAACEERGE